MNRNNLEEEIVRLKKKQRVSWALLLILILSNIGYYVYGLTSKSDETIEVRSEKYLDPDVNFVDRSDVIVNLQPLKDDYASLVDKYQSDATITLYFEYLNTGANAMVDPDLAMWPVSLTKLPLAMVVMRKVENHSLTLEDKIKILPEDYSGLSGEMTKDSVGKEFTVKELLESLIYESDNTAYYALKRITSEEERHTIVSAIGLGSLFTDQGKVSSKEYARLLRSLYYGGYLNAKHSSLLLGLMTKSTFKNFLNQGIPDGTEFAHKWGENYLYKVSSDAGIVYYENRPYILSVMIQQKNETYDPELSKNIMAEISQATYKFVSNR